MSDLIRFACVLLATLLNASPVWSMNVTFINPGKEGERFWDMVTETMQAAAEDFQVNLEVIYAQRNRVRMVAAGIAVTERETPPDYLILVNEEQAAETIMVSANRHKIPTLMLLSDFLPAQRQRVGYPGGKNPFLLGAITPDNFGAGARMMQALIDCAEATPAPPPYHFLAIGGDTLTPASIDRNNGALSVLAATGPEVRLDRFLYANWNQTEARTLTRRYLQWAERNQITPAAIWSANDPIALGARDALLESRIPPEEVCMVGLNWSAEALRLVQSGQLLLSDGGHFMAGAWSIVLLKDYNDRLTTQSTVSPIGHVMFQMQSIHRNNIERYLQHLGDENWGKIDFTRFSLGSGAANAAYDFSLERVLSATRP